MCRYVRVVSVPFGHVNRRSPGLLRGKNLSALHEEACGLGQPQVTLTVPSPTSIGGGLLPSLAGCFCIGPE